MCANYVLFKMGVGCFLDPAILKKYISKIPQSPDITCDITYPVGLALSFGGEQPPPRVLPSNIVVGEPLVST